MLEGLKEKQLPSLDELREEAHQEQDRELSANFAKLSQENRLQVVMLSRQLLQQEQKVREEQKILNLFRKLNPKGQALALAYVEALAANPKYRKM